MGVAAGNRGTPREIGLIAVGSQMGHRLARGCPWEFQRGLIGTADFSRDFMLVSAVPTGYSTSYTLWSWVVRCYNGLIAGLMLST